MKLSQLLSALTSSETRSWQDLEISGLAYHSKLAQAGELFIAIPGIQVDGHQFIFQALQQGVTAIVVERWPDFEVSVPVIKVPDTRLALSQLAHLWYQQPSQKISLAAITGTNGKTTTTCLLESMFEAAGKSAGRIGTIGFHYRGHFEALGHTTPESLEIQKMLAQMVAAQAEFAAMEVSSHALEMKRVEDICFDIALFTNLTPEHLDYHQTLENYFQAKSRLFLELLPQGKGPKHAIINIEDPYGQRLAEKLKTQGQNLWTYSLESTMGADLFPLTFESSFQGLKAKIVTPCGTFDIASPLIGRFNLSNILGSIAVALRLGIPHEKISAALKEFPIVPGRLERIENTHGFHVFVDYAHTPDALKNVLETLRDLQPARILTVFGCGGDRDRSKRPLMGKEVAKLSDLSIVTSDNPRREDPKKIIAEILPSFENAKKILHQDFWVEIDRRQAIIQAMALAQKNDVVLIAGKGHEDYQILGSQKIHFDDREIAREILGKSS